MHPRQVQAKHDKRRTSSADSPSESKTQKQAANLQSLTAEDAKRESRARRLREVFIGRRKRSCVSWTRRPLAMRRLEDGSSFGGYDNALERQTTDLAYPEEHHSAAPGRRFGGFRLRGSGTKAGP